MTSANSPEEPGPDPKLTKVPTQRARWATRKMTVKSGRSKRLSLLNRMQHKRTASEKSVGDGSGGVLGHNGPGHRDDSDDDPEEDAQGGHNGEEDDDSDDDEDSSRTIYFNLPLPDDMLEDGQPAFTYPRNKIRTAKYTPLSFVPKNLWFQFHNIANIFFLFLVILVVRLESQAPSCWSCSLTNNSVSQYLAA